MLSVGWQLFWAIIAADISLNTHHTWRPCQPLYKPHSVSSQPSCDRQHYCAHLLKKTQDERDALVLLVRHCELLLFLAAWRLCISLMLCKCIYFPIRSFSGIWGLRAGLSTFLMNWAIEKSSCLWSTIGASFNSIVNIFHKKIIVQMLF